MKTNLLLTVLLAAVLCSTAVPASAIPLAADLSGYYKFVYTDGNTYSAKATMATGGLEVCVLPDTSTIYLGTIADDKIYFVDQYNPARTGALRQIDETTSMMTAHDGDTGETWEFTITKIAKEEADEITARNQAIAKNGECANHLKVLGLLLHRFAQEHGGEMPNSLDELYPVYVSDKSVFVCPARDGEFRSFDMDYEYIPGFRTDSPNPDQEVVITEVQGSHTAPWLFHFVLYLDGHVEDKRD